MEIDEYSDETQPEPDNTKSSSKRKVTLWARLDAWVYGQSVAPDGTPHQAKKGRGRHGW